MKQPILQIKDLSVQFHTDGDTISAVENVNIHINQGEVVGLVGESGSGKTITAQSIVRLVPKPPAEFVSGEILFHGKDLMSMPIEDLRKIRGASISMIFQEPMTALSPLHRVGYQLVETLQLHNDIIDFETAWQVGETWLEKVGIPDAKQKMHAHPHELSGGMRQRVMIAMALMLEPDLIIADEPTTALDVTVQNQIFKLLMEMKDNKTALLLITHDMAVVWELCDRIYVMQHAKIVETANTEELFKRPQEKYTRELLQAVPKLYEDDEQISYDHAKVDTAVPDSALVKTEQLKVWFPVRQGLFAKTVDHVKAVDGVGLYVDAGETLGLVGESGSGKTTLGRAIIGLQKIYAGEVYFKNKLISHLNRRDMLPYRKDMQIIFQDPYSSLNPRMTVIDILTEGLVEHGMLDMSKKDKAAQLLEDVGMDTASMNRYPFEFSGGQRQRISIARALSLQPAFIVCDEAVSALDVSIQAQIIELLKTLQRKYKLAYLFITHDLSVVRQISDRIAVMHFGKIVESGMTDDVVLSPQHEYTQQLLEAVPIPGNRERRMAMRGT